MFRLTTIALACLPTLALAASLSATASADATCILKSREDALERVRPARERFEQLNQAHGMLDYVSSLTGCPRALRGRIRDSLAGFDAAASVAYPLAPEACARLVARIDRLTAWVDAYALARNTSETPDVCVGGELRVTHTVPWCAADATRSLTIVTGPQTEELALAEAAAGKVDQEPPTRKPTIAPVSQPEPPKASRAELQAQAIARVTKLLAKPELKTLEELLGDPAKVTSTETAALGSAIALQRALAEAIDASHYTDKVLPDEADAIVSALATRFPKLVELRNASKALETRLSARPAAGLQPCATLSVGRCQALISLATQGTTGAESARVYEKGFFDDPPAISLAVAGFNDSAAALAAGAHAIPTVALPAETYADLLLRATWLDEKRTNEAMFPPEYEKLKDRTSAILRQWTPEATAAIAERVAALSDVDELTVIFRHAAAIAGMRGAGGATVSGVSGKPIPADLARVELACLARLKKLGLSDAAIARKLPRRPGAAVPGYDAIIARLQRDLGAR